MTAAYVCRSCGVDFGYPQGLAVHQEFGSQWGNDDDNTKIAAKCSKEIKKSPPPDARNRFDRSLINDL